MTTTISILILITAAITIYAKLRENEPLQFIFKPLTMFLIISIVVFASPAPFGFYKSMILAGFVCSVIGDVLLIRQERFFVQGLVSFLIGHLFFIAAFWTLPVFYLLFVFLVYITVFLGILWKHLGPMKVPVSIYASAIALMSWMAVSRYFSGGQSPELYAAIGSLFFVASDSLLAFNKFRSPIPQSAIWVLGTYFAAQWLIALSV